MTLSSTGILAFVCSGYIHICHIETLLQRSPNGCTTEAAAVPDAPRKPCSGQSFATAVFNHAGNMLYAWSFGEDPSTLYVYSATAATSFGRVHLSRYSTVGLHPMRRLSHTDLVLGACQHARRQSSTPRLLTGVRLSLATQRGTSRCRYIASYNEYQRMSSPQGNTAGEHHERGCHV